jgi:hypothetical protein
VEKAEDLATGEEREDLLDEGIVLVIFLAVHPNRAIGRFGAERERLIAE